MPSTRDIRIMSALGVLAVVVPLLQTVTGLDTGLLYLAPALVLALPLLAGRYVGEDAIAAIRAAHVERRPRASSALTARLPRAPRVIAVRGAALLAHAL